MCADQLEYIFYEQGNAPLSIPNDGSSPKLP